MSQHHADPIEENVETHPVKLAIAVTVGSVALIFGIIMLAYFAIGTHRVGSSNEKANTPEAVAKRIAPVVSLMVDSSKGPVPTLTQAVAPKAADGPVVAMVIPTSAPAGAAAKPAGGEAIYQSACAACHAAGVAGAPKTGDKAGWSARIAKGKATLYDHAIKGLNAMPAKGGNPALSDGDVKAAVDYLMAKAK